MDWVEGVEEVATFAINLVICLEEADWERSLVLIVAIWAKVDYDGLIQVEDVFVDLEAEFCWQFGEE